MVLGTSVLFIHKNTIDNLYNHPPEVLKFFYLPKRAVVVTFDLILTFAFSYVFIKFWRQVPPIGQLDIFMHFFL